MIIFNESSRALVINKKFILPGSNVVKKGDLDLENSVVASWIEEGLIRVEDKVTEKVAVEAVKKANTQQIVDEIESVAPKSENVKKAARNRKTNLDAFDAEVKAANEKIKKEQVEAQASED